jgi:YidC/Oxa1 family membrane protein insertase
VVTLHNSIELPSDLSDPNSQKKPADVLGLAVGDTSGYTKLRLFAGPKAMDVLASIHATGADGKPTGPVAAAADSVRLDDDPRHAALLGAALPQRARRSQLGLGHHHRHRDLQPADAAHAADDDEVVAEDDAHPAQGGRAQEAYAHLKVSDPKRAEMNTEMMELYKTENVNMYGGCLPLLIQMPLFFAYYRVLANVIELRQAHWYWLHDLSVADPLHILPILIIASMFLVQFITPSPGMDPNQRRMMAIMMPVIFGFSMWHFASGWRSTGARAT